MVQSVVRQHQRAERQATTSFGGVGDVSNTAAERADVGESLRLENAHQLGLAARKAVPVFSTHHGFDSASTSVRVALVPQVINASRHAHGPVIFQHHHHAN